MVNNARREAANFFNNLIICGDIWENGNVIVSKIVDILHAYGVNVIVFYNHVSISLLHTYVHILIFTY